MQCCTLSGTYANSRNGIVGAQISARLLKEQSPDESGSYAQGVGLQAVGHAEPKPGYKGVSHKSRQECNTTLGGGQGKFVLPVTD